MTREPFAARLYFIPKALRGTHAVLIRLLRHYFERAPGWVILIRPQALVSPKGARLD